MNLLSMEQSCDNQLQRKKMAVACALAFKRGSYEEAVRLMRRLEHPEHVAIVFRIRLTKIMFWSEPVMEKSVLPLKCPRTKYGSQFLSRWTKIGCHILS